MQRRAGSGVSGNPPGSVRSRLARALRVQAKTRHDVGDIILCLRKRGDAAVLRHRRRSRVVCCEGERQIAMVMGEQSAQILHAALHIGEWIVGIGDAEHVGRGGHELHEPHGS